jgi:hypothetical protein
MMQEFFLLKDHFFNDSRSKVNFGYFDAFLH